MGLQENEISSKSRLITLLLSFLFVHRFYVGKHVSGIIFLLTAGGVGIWWIMDLIKIVSGSFKDQFEKFVYNWEADKKQLSITVAVLVVFFIIGIFTPKSKKLSNIDSSPEVKTISTNSADTKSTSETKSEEKPKEETTFKVGDALKFDEIEVTITKQQQMSSVGSEYFKEKASEGAVLIGIQYKFKNISSKPLSSFNNPDLILLDENNTTYDNDTGKTIFYQTEIGSDTKALSKLNPGITVKSGEVFEISKESWTKGKWNLKVKNDGKEYLVKLK